MALNACTYCNKVKSATQPLKPCNNCKTVAYCDRKCQQAHFKAHKKTCREQKIAEDHAAREQVANDKATNDAYAEQLAVEFLTSAPTEEDEQPRVVCGINDFGAAVTRTLDGEEHVQPAYTYVLRYIPPATEGGQVSYEYRDFTPAMMAAMDHMTEPEMAAYHRRVEEAMVKQWAEHDEHPDIMARVDDEERKQIERITRKFKAEQSTRCLNERS